MPRPAWWNLPNALTLSRILIAFGLFALLSAEAAGTRLVGDRATTLWTGAALFVICASTDWLDGFLARRRGQVTTFGRIADPFADKLLVLGTLICMMPLTAELIRPWFVVVLLAREFLVSGLRSYLESQGVPFGARWGGKIKMVLQSVLIPVVLVEQGVHDDAGSSIPWLFQLARILVWATLVATVVSMFDYLKVAAGAMRSQEKERAQ